MLTIYFLKKVSLFLRRELMIIQQSNLSCSGVCFSLSSVPMILWASLVVQRLKHLPGMRETRVRSLGWEDSLEKEMAIHSSTLAWRIPWREEPGGLQSMGSQRVRHNWVTNTKLIYTAVQQKLTQYCYLGGGIGVGWEQGSKGRGCMYTFS